MHALATAASLLIGAVAAFIIWNEIHRHREQIVELLLNPPRIERSAAQKRADLIEGAATGLLLGAIAAGFLIFA